ncbi:MAG TPA: response regulator transcription factor [Gammaproteobacteria bacterium]|nr:response regulator transcription factor [Gammaproteobacteria bacterium]
MDDCKVYIIDDAEEVRSAITLLMESVGLDVLAFHSADDFLSRYRTDFEGCILLDVRMPGMSGLDLQEKLNEMGDAPPVIIISGHGDIPMAVKAVQAGAINFVEKPFNEQELLDSVHRAFKVDSIQRGKNMKTEAIREKIVTLTKREKEVLYAITSGKRNKVIAADLNISLSTVEAHRGHVMQKMEAKSLSDLMRMVIYIEKESGDVA